MLTSTVCSVHGWIEQFFFSRFSGSYRIPCADPNICIVSLYNWLQCKTTSEIQPNFNSSYAYWLCLISPRLLWIQIYGLPGTVVSFDIPRNIWNIFNSQPIMFDRQIVRYNQLLLHILNIKLKYGALQQSNKANTLGSNWGGGKELQR